MDAAGSKRAVVFGVSEGGPLSILYAATHAQRVIGLICLARAPGSRGPRLPVGDDREATPARAGRDRSGVGHRGVRGSPGQGLGSAQSARGSAPRVVAGWVPPASGQPWSGRRPPSDELRHGCPRRAPSSPRPHPGAVQGGRSGLSPAPPGKWPGPSPGPGWWSSQAPTTSSGWVTPTGSSMKSSGS